MADTWHEPVIFIAEQIIYEFDMNEQVRDNLTYLKNRFVPFCITGQAFTFKSKTTGEGWLPGWTKRVKFTIDQSDITSLLKDFPILIYLSAAAGRNDDDLSFIFDELQNDANRKKIAVTTSDGETQCYVEIEKWDTTNKQAWLWAKIPRIGANVDTELYLYYDSTHPDNTDYVGEPNSVVVENVWDSNHVLVTHMVDDPDSSHIRDSTSNDNDDLKKGAGEPAEITNGKIGNAQNFDGVDDYVNFASPTSLDDLTEFTYEMWILPKQNVAEILLDKWGVKYFYIEVNRRLTVVISGATGASTTTSSVVTNEVWNKLSLVFSSNGDKKAHVYLNGVECSYAVQTAAVLPLTSDAGGNLGLGARWPGLYMFKGYIDEVRISNVARTLAWIKANYESESDDLLSWGSEEAKDFSYGWVDPVDFEAGQLIYEWDMNDQISNNLFALKNIFVPFCIAGQSFTFKSKTSGELYTLI